MFFTCKKQQKEDKHEVLQEAKEVNKNLKEVLIENHFTVQISRAMKPDVKGSNS